jgi:hypothetical protein
MNGIIHHENINPDKIILTKISSDNDILDAKFIHKITKRPVLIKTPLCSAINGIKKYAELKYKSYSCNKFMEDFYLTIENEPLLGIESEEYYPDSPYEINEFFNDMAAIDKKMLKLGVYQESMILPYIYRIPGLDFNKIKYHSCVNWYNECVKDYEPHRQINIRINKKIDGSPDIILYDKSNKHTKISSWEELNAVIKETDYIRVICCPAPFFIKNECYGVIMEGFIIYLS